LLFTLDIVSLAFGQQLALAGAAVYFLYSRKREKRTKRGINISLKENRKMPFFTGSRILVPMANPQTQEALLSVAHSLLVKNKGEIVVLSVKDVPGQVDFYEGLSDASETLEVIERGIELAKSQETEIRPVVRAARNIASGIIEGAEEENSDLIIMGYADHKGNSQINTMDKVMKFSTTDMVFLRLRGSARTFRPKKILVYLSKYVSIDLLFVVATAIAENYGSRLTLLYQLPEGYSKKQKTKTDRMVAANLQKFNSMALYDVELKVTNHVARDLIHLSAEYDLLVFSAKHQKLTKEAIASAIEFQVTEQSHCSVLIVKEVPGYKKVMGRI